MREFILDFSFKGDRNYVHGSDLYVKIENELRNRGFEGWTQFELNIKNVCHNNLICTLSSEKNVQENEVINFSVKKNGSKLYGSIIENHDHKIETNYPYNEAGIFEHCISDPQIGQITYSNENNEYTGIEIILAMAKHYLEEHVDPAVKWFFRRIVLNRPLDGVESHPIMIKMISQKAGFVGFDLYVGDTKQGGGYAVAL